MDKFTPYEKLSKSDRRALDGKRRATWGAFNPVTRKPQNPKAYNRKKTRQGSEDAESHFDGSYVLYGYTVRRLFYVKTKLFHKRLT